MKVALLGGGQLARMLAIAAHRLGMEPWVVDPKPDAPAACVARTVLGALDDPATARALADCEVATAEFDHAPPAALARIARQVPVRPGPEAFEVAGDRLLEKRLFRSLGIPTAPFEPVSSLAELERAIGRIGLPAILKTRHAGYDGRGQVVIRDAARARDAWQAVAGQPALVEGLVPFKREISILAARGLDGDVRFWSPVENRHEDGILRRSRPLEADTGADAAFARDARRAAEAVLSALDYVGVMALELFDVDGQPWANEIASRVHNSGHWTEEGAETSQFENHLRAIAGWPLGGTGLLGPTAMVNLIGELPPREVLLSLPGARVHLYGKAPAPGRKLGHVTLRAATAAALDESLRVAEAAAAAASRTDDARPA